MSSRSFSIYDRDIVSAQKHTQLSKNVIKGILRAGLYDLVGGAMTVSKTNTITSKDLDRYLKLRRKMVKSLQKGGDSAMPATYTPTMTPGNASNYVSLTKNPNFCIGKEFISQCIDFNASCTVPQTGGRGKNLHKTTQVGGLFNQKDFENMTNRVVRNLGNTKGLAKSFSNKVQGMLEKALNAQSNQNKKTLKDRFAGLLNHNAQ